MNWKQTRFSLGQIAQTLSAGFKATNGSAGHTRAADNNLLASRKLGAIIYVEQRAATVSNRVATTVGRRAKKRRKFTRPPSDAGAPRHRFPRGWCLFSSRRPLPLVRADFVALYKLLR